MYQYIFSVNIHQRVEHHHQCLRDMKLELTRDQTCHIPRKKHLKKTVVVEETEVEEVEIKRKPSNVIYVVSKPQPGQVRGDWAVRGHGKIYSRHRTKQAAIKQARVTARGEEATVMVQNTNGTFSKGFEPRSKKK